MPRMRQVHADLVHASRQRQRPHQCERRISLGKTLEHFHARLSAGPFRVHHLFEINVGGLIIALASNGRVDLQLFPLRPAIDQSRVSLPDFVGLHQERKLPGACRGFTDQDQAAGLAVEPVDNRDLSPVDHLEGQKLPQPVPECVTAVGLARVHLQMGRLVNNHPLGALVDELELPAAVDLLFPTHGLESFSAVATNCEG